MQRSEGEISPSIFQNASWSGISTAFRTAAGLGNSFLAIRLLGTEQYGHIATIMSLFALYLALNVNIFTVVATRLMRERADEFISEKFGELYSVAVQFTLFSIGFLLIVFPTLIAIFSKYVLMQNTLEKTLFPSIWQLVFMMAFLTAIQIVTAFNSACLEGIGRLEIAMKCQLPGPILILIIFSGLFAAKPAIGAEEYFAALSCGSILDSSLLIYSRKKLLPFPHHTNFSRERFYLVGTLIKSGGLLQGASLMNAFLEPLNKFLLNHFVGATAVTRYDLAMKMIWGIQSLFGAAMRVFLQISAEGGPAVSRAFAKVIKFIGVPAVICHSVAALTLIWVSRYWFTIDSSSMISFFAIATVSNLGMIYITPLYVALVGKNDLAFIFRSQTILALSNLILSITLIPIFGLIGAAFGLLVATLYNVTAIYRRYHGTVAILEGVTETLSSGIGRYTISFILFFGVITLGICGFPNVLIEILLFIGLTILLIREPIVHELRLRRKHA